MKKYNLNKNFNLLISKIGDYYANTLIDILLEDNNLQCGWFETNGINNDKIIYRITKKQ